MYGDPIQKGKQAAAAEPSPCSEMLKALEIEHSLTDIQACCNRLLTW